MKFYKLNNTWVSWDELHNGYGYTTEPSIAVTYKSAHNGSSWGEDAGSGYYVGDIDDMVHGSFWCDIDYGWFELDGLVWNPEIYPSNATPLMMQNGGLTSPAVSLESDGVTYYLIKAIVADTGWITADEAAELGWEVYDEMQGTFIVFDTVENKIVSAFTNELTYGEIEGIILQSPRLVYGVDITVPTAQFWFTANGRNETENTVLQPNNTVTVYDENGDMIADEDTIGMYDTASVLAYMQADGDMISKQDDVLIDNDGELGLQVDRGPISAWSVFAERVFTLSFANTQLPDITITMPADETGYKGTSIALPTMSGEYESGGKTWKPSAWDIGAFGSSYSLTGDTVAHLVFEEVPPSVVLPEVTSMGRLINSWGTLIAGQTETLRDSNGNTVPYDTTACYACEDYYGSGGEGPGTNRDLLSIINVNSILKVTASAYFGYVYYVYVRKCSSNLATVVPVYNSSNVVYNAFKFTASGTDYYYVLEDTQDDWVSDLSSIGYSLSPFTT
jgi:hypothetical protein